MAARDLSPDAPLPPSALPAHGLWRRLTASDAWRARIGEPRRGPQFVACPGWLPRGRCAAVCFSIDDVHPRRSTEGYDAGGDLAAGALGRLERLLERHPQLKATLFVVPDWRLAHLVPTRRLFAETPWIRDLAYRTPVHRGGRFRVDRFPAFVSYINGLPRTEVALHGLTHAHRGPKIATEFQQQGWRACRRKIEQAEEIFAHAGLHFVRGFQPPAWSAPAALAEALIHARFDYLSAARDLETAVTPRSRADMSGPRGASLISPEWVVLDEASAARSLPAHPMIHVTTNYQATSSPARAHCIVRLGGLLSIKAHVFKCGGGITLLDGLDDAYANVLDRLFCELEDRYGDELWWTTFSEIAARCRAIRGSQSN